MAAAFAGGRYFAQGADVKPVLQAILLAEHVYQDRSTGKFVIAGTFNRIRVTPNSTIPELQSTSAGPVRAPGMTAGSPTVYLSVTGIHGEAQLELRYTDLVDDSILFKCDLGVVAKDPLATAEIGLPLPPLPTPHAGTYALELLWNGEILGSHRVAVENGGKDTQERREGDE
jgi:hypothetical protein